MYVIVELFFLKRDLNLNGDSIIMSDIEVLIKPQSGAADAETSLFLMPQMEATEN